MRGTSSLTNGSEAVQIRPISRAGEGATSVAWSGVYRPTSGYGRAARDSGDGACVNLYFGRHTARKNARDRGATMHLIEHLPPTALVAQVHATFRGLQRIRQL
jgi:hypothetical protein